jgi:hypothetical protein
LLENYKLSGSSLEALWELVAVAGISAMVSTFIDDEKEQG